MKRAHFFIMAFILLIQIVCIGLGISYLSHYENRSYLKDER